MRPYAELATFTGAPGCYGIAVDPSGQWLLDNYDLTPPRAIGPIGAPRRAWGSRGKLHIARINTTTGARSDITVWTQPGFGSTSPPGPLGLSW